MLKLFWECLTVWSVPPTSLQGAQAIIVHAAGENSPTDPGDVNRYNAEIVRNLYQRFKIPVIVQGEIAPCLKDIPLFAVSHLQAEVTPNYLESEDIVLWHKEECDRIGATKVILVSYGNHYWRAMKATEKVGLIVLVPEGIAYVHDSRNSQWWAKYETPNRFYEVAQRFRYLKKGWI